MRSITKSIRTMVVGVLVLCALVVLLTGRPSSSVNADPSSQVVVVDYWEKWTGKEGQQIQEIVDDFNATVGKEKRIFVRCVSTSQISQKTLIATAAGVPPDIAGVWDAAIPQLASLNALMPLDEFAKEHGITRDTYKPVYWDSCVFEGKLMSLISTPATIALHINMKLVRENADQMRSAGLDPDVPPRTLDELDAWAIALDKFDDKGQLVRSGYLPLEPGWYVNQTPLWFGGSVFDESSGRFTLTSDACVKAFEWVASYSRRLGFQAITEFRSSQGNFNSPQNAFLAGNVVMVQQGPWMANYIRKLKPSMSGASPIERIEDEVNLPLEMRLPRYDWIAVPFPSAELGKTGVTFATFDALVIPRGAKHPREAFEFIAYLQRREVHEKLNMLHCKNSALADVSDRFLNHHPNPYIRVFEDLAKSPNASGQLKFEIAPVVAEELGTVVQQIARLEVEPRIALEESQLRLQAKLDQFRARQKLREPGDTGIPEAAQ